MIQPEQMIFGVIAAVVLGSALMVVTLRSIIHCAVFLVFSLLGVAGLYVLLNAEFLAAAQVVVYVGAISVLILFGVMMTQEVSGGRVRSHNGQVLPSMALAGVLLALVLVPTIARTWRHAPKPGAPIADTLSVVGTQLLTTYLLPFELASLLLLVAMVGAIVMAMLSDRPEPLTMAAPAPAAQPKAIPTAAEVEAEAQAKAMLEENKVR